MSDEDLKKLLERTKAEPPPPKNRIEKVRPPTPDHRKGAFEHSWTSIGKITAPYKPKDINRTDMFAVIEAAHGQFKVLPDDRIFLHRLNGDDVETTRQRQSAEPSGNAPSVPHTRTRVDVNDVIQFNRVLLCGTPSDTLIGRPYLQGVTVTAAIEEHIRDSTVYIYKRKRAKGYRRFRGFRAELTAVRILGIHGTEALGVPVPAWDKDNSTPLQAPLSLGQRVRNNRKLRNRQKRREDREAVQEWLEARKPRLPSFEMGTVSTPFDPDEYALGHTEGSNDEALSVADANQLAISTDAPSSTAVDAPDDGDSSPKR